MAERRMFAKSIVLSDAFLDMPLSARCLYFTLGMLADDDGFVGSPKGIMRQCGASQDDMLMLLQKRFILAFDSGVIVIKHWRMNNYLQSDRHKKTTYIDELETLEIDKKGAYTERKDAMYTKCIQNVYTGKDSIGKVSIDKDSIYTPLYPPTDEGETPKPKKAVNQFKQMIHETDLSAEIKSKLEEWVDYKKDIKKPYKTERGFKQLLTIVANYSLKFSDQDIVDVINFSMSNEYQGIVWDRLNKKTGIITQKESFQQTDMKDALSEIEDLYMNGVGGQ